MFSCSQKHAFYRLISHLLILGIFALPSCALGTKAHQQVKTGAPGLENVQSFPDEGRWHFEPGEKWEYRSNPPTSGPHDPVPVKPGFYSVPQAPEKLVHSLEHGSIVIYYEKPAPETMKKLKEWVGHYTGKWDGVIVTPMAGLCGGVILTAWTKMLRLDPFDARQATAFLDAFRGHGPEHGQNEMDF
jgi:hypothetical protein